MSLTLPRRLVSFDPLRIALRRLKRLMPKGLYTRSLLIVVLPIVILQSVVAFAFMERHWQLVTRRLSAAVSADVGALAELLQQQHTPADIARIRAIAADNLGLTVDFIPGDTLPPPSPKPFFSLLDETLSEEVAARVEQPFWIDTVGSSNFVEIRVKLTDGVMRVVARRSQAYASNSHIFLVWMLGASFILVTVAILFLRNQIRPILTLADAAESFGKGRDVVDFRPRGASEVRRAANAFLAMKRRIERQIEQRTTMLAGVSHDLRTVLTRFKLELELLGDSPDVETMKADVAEMERMLNDYLAFARGDSGEATQPTDLAALVSEVAQNAARGTEASISVAAEGDLTVTLRPDAFRRCLGNLLANAVRYGGRIQVAAQRRAGEIVITVDDDGPGIPEDMREEVFRPFLRLDESRNQDHAGSGLGLAIARDIARSHGGEIVLDQSALGGLRARVTVPV